MKIGDKFLEKFEEHHGKAQTRFLTWIFGYAIIIVSIGLIVGVVVKIISFSVFNVIIPLVTLLQKFDFSKITHIKSKLISDVVVAISASSVSVVIVWTILSTMTWSLIQNVRLWLDNRDLSQRMNSIRGALKEVQVDFGEIRQAHDSFHDCLINQLDALQSELRSLKEDADKQETEFRSALQEIRDKDEEIAALKERLIREEKP